MSCEINFKETAVQRRSQRPNSGNHPAPPSAPLPETPDAHAVSGSLNISFSELVSLLRLSAFLYGGCVLTGQSAKLWQLVKSHFPTYFLIPLYKYGS